MASLNYKTEDGWKKVAGGKTGVLTFNGRAGVVTPKEGDYTAEMVGARPNTWMPNIAEVGGVNPNLLHNWYFANPVNQRAEYWIKPNSPIYKGADTTLEPYTSDQYIKVDTYNENNWCGVTIDGEGYSVWSVYCVPRYVGECYSIDRWLTFWSTVVSLEDGGLKLTKDQNVVLIEQRLERSVLEALAGKEVTISVLSSSGLQWRTLTLPSDINTLWDTQEVWTDNLAWDIYGNPSDVCAFRCFSGEPAGTSWLIYAVKLELGSTQTLAHQDADGNWVLNEIPDYGEELRKCQRYFERVHIEGGCQGHVWHNRQVQFEFSYKTTKRATPQITAPEMYVVSAATNVGIGGAFVKMPPNYTGATEDMCCLAWLRTDTEDPFEGITSNSVVYLSNDGNLYFDVNAEL